MDFLFRRIAWVAAAAALLPIANGVAAQDSAAWPARPLRFMIGFGPGGSTDLMSRLFAQKLAERLGQPVVPDLRTGASGTIAADAVAKAPPDGLTMIMLTGAHPVVAVMRRSLPHDPLRDFAMITTVVAYPVAIVVPDASPYKSIEELLAVARSAPRRISFASVGQGSGQHLIGEWIGAEAGLEFLHVPFRGAPAALTELLAGRVDMMIDTMTSAYPNVVAGRTRALALTTRNGSRFLPDVPSISRVLPNVDFASWAGIATTGGTPPAIVDRLNRELHAILRLPEVQKQLAALGGEPSPSTPEGMQKLIANEMGRWSKVIADRNIERQ
ncbi:MAG: tripartite tricarboxylate transporter substrate binding protein [Betaproteobacteria bacterium]|nr:tripartite tricarboxylate transporter substrate binding protein [Betaproteobacteria bacterium]